MVLIFNQIYEENRINIRVRFKTDQGTKLCIINPA